MKSPPIICLAIFAALAQGQAPDRTKAKGRTLLFVDDYDILHRTGTERFMVTPTRHEANPLIRMEKKWEVAIGWTSVHRDPATNNYQLWYQAYAGKRAGDRALYCVVCYAESKDGITFEKPELDLLPFKDFEKTNIVLLSNGGYGDRYCNSVLVDPREKDPAKRYKMAYYDWSVDAGQEYPGLHVALSPDGIRWTKHPKGPLLRTAYGGRGMQPTFTDEASFQQTFDPVKKLYRKTWIMPMSMSDAVDVFWDPIRQVFVIYGKFWIPSPLGGHAFKHAMGRTESKDFIHWSKPEIILTPDDKDAEHVEFHTSPVFYHAERYFCLNQIMDRRVKGATDIELMTSRDGLAWERTFRDTLFLPRDPRPSRFDSRSIYTNATPVILEDEIRFYYGAYSNGTIGGAKLDGKDERSGVGMASIPRDRFAGVRTKAKTAHVTLRQPLENVGQVTLKPLDLAGCKQMHVNADGRQGKVLVELLSEDGYRLRGFAKEDAFPIEGDDIRHAVAWKDKTLADLPAGRYQVRLHLEKASVFAVTFR